jgi:hypothetical protein
MLNLYMNKQFTMPYSIQIHEEIVNSEDSSSYRRKMRMGEPMRSSQQLCLSFFSSASKKMYPHHLLPVHPLISSKAIKREKKGLSANIVKPDKAKTEYITTMPLFFSSLENHGSNDIQTAYKPYLA